MPARSGPQRGARTSSAAATNSCGDVAASILATFMLSSFDLSLSLAASRTRAFSNASKSAETSGIAS
eukprot:scaffold119413_cov74-Phaeocystis_antarctica.AAC.5